MPNFFLRVPFQCPRQESPGGPRCRSGQQSPGEEGGTQEVGWKIKLKGGNNIFFSFCFDCNNERIWKNGWLLFFRHKPKRYRRVTFGNPSIFEKRNRGRLFRKMYATQMFVLHDTKTKEMIAFDKKTLNYNNYFTVFPLDLRGWLMKRWRQPRVCHKRKPKEKKRENERSDRDIMAANGPFLLLQQRGSHFIFLLSSFSFSLFLPLPCGKTRFSRN